MSCLSRRPSACVARSNLNTGGTTLCAARRCDRYRYRTCRTIRDRAGLRRGTPSAGTISCGARVPHTRIHPTPRPSGRNKSEPCAGQAPSGWIADAPRRPEMRRPSSTPATPRHRDRPDGSNDGDLEPRLQPIRRLTVSPNERGQASIRHQCGQHFGPRMIADRSGNSDYARTITHSSMLDEPYAYSNPLDSSH